MRALALSDIHENVEHLLRLRKFERNEYEAIVVAGDIGGRRATEVFRILDTFECPVVCVYGNWDRQLDYQAQLSSRCRLLHMSILWVGNVAFTGFSGAPTGWGKNPLYLEEMEPVEERNREILALWKVEKERFNKTRSEIDASHEQSLTRLGARHKDRRTKKYRDAVSRLEEKKWRQIESARGALRRLEESAEYERYQADALRASDVALLRNREELLTVVERSGVPHDRLIVVTHERLIRLAGWGPPPLLHIFGHAHEYTFTRFKGTWFLNAAAIYNGSSEAFGRSKLLPEGYCVVEVVPGNVIVQRRNLRPGVGGR